MTVMRKKSQETIPGFCVAPSQDQRGKFHPHHPDLLVYAPVVCHTPLKVLQESSSTFPKKE